MTINVTKKFTGMEDLKKKKPEPVENFKKNERESREKAIDSLRNAPLELERKDN